MTSQSSLTEIDTDLLTMCRICHDQCLFATAEVLASGRQTLATSRKAAIIDQVRQGNFEWSPAAVAAIYSALNSGIQHEFCVHFGAPGGWPDETDYVRAARANIIQTQCAPDYVNATLKTWEETGNPYGVRDLDDPENSNSEGLVLLYLDSATRRLVPEQLEVCRGISQVLEGELKLLGCGTSGFELFDLGLRDQARSSLDRLAGRFGQADLIVSDSPEAVWMLTEGARRLGGPRFPPAVDLLSWLFKQTEGHRDLHLAPTGDGGSLRNVAVTYQDPSHLGRYGEGSYEIPRKLIRETLGCELREMRYSRSQAMPTGPYLGYPSESQAQEIARLRLTQAEATGADVILVASPHDFYNLAQISDARTRVLYLPSLVKPTR
jgi:hypothetical protein